MSKQKKWVKIAAAKNEKELVELINEFHHSNIFYIKGTSVYNGGVLFDKGKITILKTKLIYQIKL